MSEQFIVDWQSGDAVCPAASLVSLRMHGRGAGLYRVRSANPREMLLSHGAISFPVGTHLEVEDVPGTGADKPLHPARVVANDRSGVRLAW